jgi:hypothetical protein
VTALGQNGLLQLIVVVLESNREKKKDLVGQASPGRSPGQACPSFLIDRLEDYPTIIDCAPSPFVTGAKLLKTAIEAA